MLVWCSPHRYWYPIRWFYNRVSEIKNDLQYHQMCLPIKWPLRWVTFEIRPCWLFVNNQRGLNDGCWFESRARTHLTGTNSLNNIVKVMLDSSMVSDSVPVWCSCTLIWSKVYKLMWTLCDCSCDFVRTDRTLISTIGIISKNDNIGKTAIEGQRANGEGFECLKAQVRLFRGKVGWEQEESVDWIW
jgi:hypothetical protein